MNTTRIYKAKESGAPVIPVEIIIADELPQLTTLAETDAMMLREAKAIEEALVNALPGGTYDRLLGLMLARKATHLRVPHRF